MTSETSYRESHKAKGLDYQESFENRHRSMVWRLEQRALDLLLADLFPSGVGSYLDFACGTGRILSYIGTRARSAVGVDISPSMLEVAAQNAPFARLVEADLTSADPLGDEAFDLVSSFRFFPNAEPALRSQAIEAIERHIAPGGYLVFNNHKSRTSLVRRIAHLLGREVDPVVMSRDEVTSLLAEVGLEVVRAFPIASLPFTEQNMPLPAALVEPIEAVAMRLPAFEAISANVIYAATR